MAGRIVTETDITEQDLKAFFNYTIWLKQPLTVPLLIFAAGTSLVLVTQGGWAMWAGAALLCFVFWYVSSRLKLWRKFKRVALVTGGLRQKYRVSVDSNAIVMENRIDQSVTKYRWNKIHEVRETGKHFFFYLAPFSAVIIPKRSLSDPEIAGLHQFVGLRFGKKYSRI